MPRSYTDQEFIAIFWQRVEKTADCWLWRGARHERGYGLIRKNGKLIRAHRMAWELTNGAIPEGFHVLHQCDNPPCVNPGHLWLGTHLENMEDRDKKNRGNTLRGEKVGSAKLTAWDVFCIRDLCAKGYLQKDCATLWGISNAAVNSLVLRDTWRHL